VTATRAPVIDLESKMPLAADQIIFNAQRDPISDDGLAVVRGEMVHNGECDPAIKLVVDHTPIHRKNSQNITMSQDQFSAILHALDQLKLQVLALARGNE
jgi:hypothetical protein